MSNSAKLGKSGASARVGQREVSSIALGCMGLSYHGVLDDDYGAGVIQEALDRGVTVIDTADVYGPYGAPGTSERLVSRALGGWPRDSRHIVVATKGGHIRNRDDSIRRDGRPEYLKRACEASLRALNVQTIDLYQLHGPDKEVPFVDSVGALAELQQEGKIRDIGLSNVGRAHIEIARELVEVVSVQNRFSPLDRSAGRVVQYCSQLGIAFLCWGPLAGPRAQDLPRLVPELGVVGSAHGATAYQVALAWEIALAPGVIPVVGAMSRTDIAHAVEACDLILSATELALISRCLPQ
jgi:aryl-alcohol dehydrogenase-like predicted oxidoreductase